MPSIREQAVLELRIDGAGNVVSQLKNVQNATEQTFSKSEQAMSSMEKSMARGFSNMINQYLGFAAAFRTATKVLSEGVEFNKFVENTTMSFSVMMKSADQAKTMMKDLYDFAVNSPLTFKETASSSKQLMAYGFAAKDLIPTMKTLGSVAIATGHSLDDISYIYGTLKSQGRAYSRDLMQFGMRGIPIYEELAKVLNVDASAIQKMASEGKIGFAEVEKAFQNMTTGSGRFAGIIEGYMTTLTGKLSMLSDMAQQSAGTLTSGLMTSLKTFVDNLTKMISQKGFQSFIATMSEDLEKIANALFMSVEILIKLLPLLTAFLKVWIAIKAIGIVNSILKGIPTLLLSIGEGALSASGNLLKMIPAFTDITVSIKLMGSALLDMFTALMANPVFMALLGLSALVTGVVIASKIISGNAAAKNVASEDVRKTNLAGDLARGANSGTNFLKPEDIKSIAEQYALSEEATVKIAVQQRAISQSAWDTYAANKQIYDLAMKRIANPNAYGQGGPTIGQSTDSIQASFLGNLNGKAADYYMPNKTDTEPGAKGHAGALDYIKSVQDTFDQNKLDWGAYYNEDLAKEAATTALKAIDTAAEEGKGVHYLFDQTQYDEDLAVARKKWEDFLASLGDKTKKAEKAFPKLGTWWSPIVQAAKLTLPEIDDINVSTAKTVESAWDEYEARKATHLEQIKATDTTRAQVLSIMAAMNDEYAIMLQYEKDINTEGAKQVVLKNYEYKTQGNAAYFEGLRATAGSTSGAISAGNTMAAGMEGTQVGSLMSGADPLSMAAQSAMEFAKSIKNVDAVLNPFKTLLEGARAILEPIANNAFKPLVQMLTQLGAVVAHILAPFMGIYKIITVFAYAIGALLLAPLQMLGKAFEWLYNSVIVPFGNGFIDVVNGLIYVLNSVLGMFGVDIEYIDRLQTTNEALQDLTSSINNQKSALDQTIDYLTKKINDAIDEQISGYKDLYEVGAITASEYAAKAAGLNSGKVPTEALLVSMQDMNLTGADIYTRLADLYSVKDALNNPNLTDIQIRKILTDAGMSSESAESSMKRGVLAALQAYMGMTYVPAIVNVDGSTNKTTPKTPPSAPAAPDNSSMIEGLQKQLRDAVVSWNEYKQTHNILQITAATWDNESTIAGLRTAIIGLGGTPSYAVGTGNIPNDMMANIHKGEGIIPATFMDSIRSGELSLSGGKGTSSNQGNIIVNLTVQGSVTSENDLIDAVAKGIDKQRSRGLLTA